MKALVIGGSGFLGSHVADMLLHNKIEVVVFDRKASEYLDDRQQMILGNILNSSQIEQAVKGCDVVYHFAGVANLDDASTRPIDTVEFNIKGTCMILDACVKYGVKRFIYASSFYAHSGKGGFYRCSKQATEMYIEEYSRKYGIGYTILRYGSLYGPRTSSSNGIYDMLKGAYYNSQIHYPGTGEELREYIHVRDAAKLSIKVLEDEYENQHIILTGHEAIRVRDVIEMIKEIMDKPIDVIYDKQDSELHYHMTPYSFKPQYSYKLTDNQYIDIGQGLIECLQEIDEKENGKTN